MKITFVIGNGFDLNLGLRTTYKDFYNNYIRTLDQEDIDDNLLYKYIYENIENWVDFETALGLFTFYSGNSNSNNEKKLLIQAKLFSEENKFIENELFNDKNFSSEKFLSALTDFRKNFKKYLIQESKKLDNVKETLSDILLNGLTNFADDYDDNEKISIYSNMYNQAYNINGGLRLSIEYSLLTFNYTEFLEIGKKYIDSSVISKKIYQNFITEAYTDCEITTSVGQVYHIHSKLNGGMFLGVDNDSQLNNELFSKKELSTLIKPLSNQLHNNNITDRANIEIENSNIIVIYGTALGITDLTWWKKIILFLKKYHKNIVLIHKYDMEINIEEDDFFSLADEKEDIKQHLLSFDDTLTSDEIAKLKKQIFVNLNSEKIFDSTILKKQIQNIKDQNKIHSTLLKNALR